MDPSSLILIGVTVVVILATAGVFSIAFSRSVVSHRQQAAADVKPSARKALSGRRGHSVVGAEFDPVGATLATPQEPVESVPVRIVERQRVVEVSTEEGGVTRRQFFNRALAGSFGAFLAVLGLDALAFFWPRLTGGFGSKVDAGPVDDIKAQLAQTAGSVVPFVVSEARAYVVAIEPDQVQGSQFSQAGLVADGLMAMWWRCVHLGCRAPWCAPSAGFECPCHGSKYNLFGEYQAGPAPRNLDRFAVEVSSDGRLMIDTGTIVQTPRAPTDTVPYPQGPSCIAI